MKTWTPDPESPTADRQECFIATAVATIIAATAAAAGTTVAAHMQSGAAEEGLKAQTKASEEALAYQKEQDAYDRARQARLDELNISRYNFGVAQEGRRYGDYTANIAPYLATGSSANARMAQILGLAPPAPYTPTMAPSAAPTSASAPAGEDYQGWFTQQIAGKPFNQQTLLDLEPTLNAAGWRLTPPNAAGERTKVQTPTGEWVRVGFGEGKPVWVPQGVITEPLPMPTKSPAASPATPQSPRVTTEPVGTPQPLKTVQMRAPDGTVQAVPVEAVAHYKSLGAEVIQ
jgi:hypothetical protein